MSEIESTLVPIITANFKPFRLVRRGVADSWNPTLKQINSREYDHVRLHRMSTYLDVGIAPLSMGVCFDGTLVLPATPELRDVQSALALFNRTLSELVVGGIYCEAVQPEDIGYGSLTLQGYTRLLGGGEGASISLHKAARTKHIGTLDVIRLLNPETLDHTELENAFSAGRKRLQKLDGIPREQLLYAITYYVKRQWAESLIHAWTTTERIIEIAWASHVSNSVLAASKKRKQFLNDHRTWTSSAKLEVLFQKSLLPIETYEKLDVARKGRNAFAHEGLVPTQEIVLKALAGGLELASLCITEFQDPTIFKHVIDLANSRCNAELYPKKTQFSDAEVSHWLALPPIPGFKEWGDEPFEIIEDICLQELSPRVQTRSDESGHA
jgi:hypothetical protein